MKTLLALLLLQAPAARANLVACAHAPTRTQFLTSYSARSPIESAETFRSAYWEERKKEGTPAHDAVGFLLGYLDENYEGTVALSRGLAAKDAEGYSWLYDAVNRYKAQELDKDKFIASLLAEPKWIPMYKGWAARLFVGKLDELLMELNVSQREHRLRVFEQIDKAVCAKLLSGAQAP